MKKILALLMTLFMGLIGFAACSSNDSGNGSNTGNSSNSGNTGSSSNSGNTGNTGNGNTGNNNVDLEGRQYITHFDGYTQCIVFPCATFQSSIFEGGRVINDWITDSKYVSEGTGSIKVSLREGWVNWYKGKIAANNGFVSNITDINGAKKISLDVYNPENKEIDVTIDIESTSNVLVTVSQTCQPKSWTTVSTEIEGKDYATVSWYSITLKNNVDSDVFTVYLDNFYLEF